MSRSEIHPNYIISTLYHNLSFIIEIVRLIYPLPTLHFQYTLEAGKGVLLMRKQAVDFRKDEVTYISKRWQATESCSLVGVGSVGKSNLLQHLSDKDTHVRYLGAEKAQNFAAIIVDPHMLGPLPSGTPDEEQFRCWAGYELMMHRLYLSFYPLEILEDDAIRFFDTYQALQDGSNPLFAYMGLRYFELGLEFFLRRGVQIVFMFDEFEEMLSQMPDKFFHTLRGIRDRHKSQISFLAFTRTPLPLLVAKQQRSADSLEPFVEQFTDNVYFVGPYNEADARTMTKRLLSRIGINQQQEHLVNFLLYATGRYAGLLRASVKMIDNQRLGDPSTTPAEQLITKLANWRPVQTECQTIWNSLSSAEHDVLKIAGQIAKPKTSAESEKAIGLLVHKRLLKVDKDSESIDIEPPIFKAFIQNSKEIT